VPAAALSSLSIRTITRFSTEREAHFEAGNVAIRSGLMAVRNMAATDDPAEVFEQARVYLRERGVNTGYGWAPLENGAWLLTLHGSV